MAEIEIRQPRYRQMYFDDEMAENACVRWAEIVQHLKENNLLSTVRLRMADRYVRAMVEYDSLYPTALKDGPVKTGPKGGDFYNMTWGAIERLNDRIAKFEDAFLISPKAAGGKIYDRPKETPKTAADEFLD